MNQYLTISELKDRAKEHLAGNYSKATLQTLLYNGLVVVITSTFSTVLTFIMQLTMLSASNGAANYTLSTEATTVFYIIQYIIDFLLSVFSGIFSTGMALFCLKIASGKAAVISDLFYGFQYLFKKSITLSAATTLLYYVCMLPYNVFYYFNSMDASGKWILYMVVSLLAGLIVYVPVSLSLSQVFFLLLDFPSYSAKEILGLSIRIMKGRKGKLFLLQLSFIPIMVLGVLSLGLGFLWIMPYMNMTQALYFLDIMKPKATTATVK